MQNIEKYSKEIVEIALNSDSIAVNRYTGDPCACSTIGCTECAFNDGHEYCSTQRKEWAQREYEEKPKCGMLNDKAYANLREVISDHIDKVYSHCNQSDCANCPYDYSANCRELLLFESLFKSGWSISRDTIDDFNTMITGNIVLNKESYSKL